VSGRRTPGSRWLRIALVGGPALYGVLMLLTRLALTGTGALSFDAVDGFDFWAGIVLLAALPSLGAPCLERVQHPPYCVIVPREATP